MISYLSNYISSRRCELWEIQVSTLCLQINSRFFFFNENQIYCKHIFLDILIVEICTIVIYGHLSFIRYLMDAPAALTYLQFCKAADPINTSIHASIWARCNVQRSSLESASHVRKKFSIQVEDHFFGCVFFFFCMRTGLAMKPTHFSSFCVPKWSFRLKSFVQMQQVHRALELSKVNDSFPIPSKKTVALSWQELQLCKKYERDISWTNPECFFPFDFDYRTR